MEFCEFCVPKIDLVYTLLMRLNPRFQVTVHHCVLKECFQKGICTVCVTAVQVSMETLKNVLARNVPPTARLVSMEKRTTCVQVVTLNFFSKVLCNT